MKLKYSLFALIAINANLLANEVLNFDQMSITATKVETATKEVTQSIAVVDEKTIEDKNILNIQQAIENIPGVIAESSSNSPSPKLIIRGAGLKARYGVREIMVMKDGVPMTDPDSFTRFDYIDMQDVSSIEVQKGPGSINAANATGGVIQLVTKSVFDDSSNRIKLGIGDDGQQNLNLKVGDKITENDFASMTFSSRKIDNSWRDNNDFDSSQLSLKYGHIFKDDSTIESEIAYTKSNMNLPASMTKTEFEEFKQTGKQHYTSDIWQNSARDSEILSLNTKYEKEVGNFTFKPRFYFNTWDHYHPVTGMINDSDDNNVFGTDLELNNNHELFSNDAIFVTGLTWKKDKTNDAKKYTYRDLDTTTTTSWSGTTTTINKTLSNEKGDLASREDTDTTLYGIYAMESFKPSDKLSIDISARLDKLDFDISSKDYITYNYSNDSYNYLTSTQEENIDKSYTLLSNKLGLSYAISDTTNIYTSISRANQAPTTSELGTNEGLDKTTSINYEIGLKNRSNDFAYDLAVYQNNVKDEVVQIINSSSQTDYANAGETEKRGLEFNLAYNLTKNLQTGGAYAYSDYTYKSFTETYYSSTLRRMTEASRDGNYLPYIPKKQYSIFLALNLDNGFKSRVTAKTYGSYYMDNANTQKYEGYDLITDLMIGYEMKNHNIQLNVNNVFDKYYAMDASKSTSGEETYKAAAPRSTMLTYSYKF
ncbi:TonB-dependent receptor [bacterium]|jgi:iron complex outermembrane recepter protein|nr:TonB-dependent receptor [bacterium]